MLSWIRYAQLQLPAPARWIDRWWSSSPAEVEVGPFRDDFATPEQFEIDRYDPLLSFLAANPRATLVDRIPVSSPAVDRLRQAGITVVVPLVTHGKVIGIINLGSRMSQQSYSRDDLNLLDSLALQAAPALRVAQLVREEQINLQERERISHQLRLARDIQKTLLPKGTPELPGWQISAYYQPAWEVGGDFYDFIHFPDGQLGIIIGDVTDKGMPSALVMASTRSLLRAAAERDPAPAAVLASANRSLEEDIPPMMFVTCFYLLLDPATGRVRYANAGHDLPFRRAGGQISELRATGMPLGLMPDIVYTEEEAVLDHGETIVLYSDGLVEAHNTSGDMLGFPRVEQIIGSVSAEGPALIRTLLDDLTMFTGPEWRQEDDVTLVTLTRSRDRNDMNHDPADQPGQVQQTERELDRFLVPSAPGNEILAIERVVQSVANVPLSRRRLEMLQTAVGETVMNGMEHGNRFRQDLPVQVSVAVAGDQLIVRVFDAGTELPPEDAPLPDLEAKLAGQEPPRGWGLFLIRSMVDDVRVIPSPSGKTTELIVNLEGASE